MEDLVQGRRFAATANRLGAPAPTGRSARVADERPTPRPMMNREIVSSARLGEEGRGQGADDHGPPPGPP